MMTVVDQLEEGAYVDGAISPIAQHDEGELLLSLSVRYAIPIETMACILGDIEDALAERTKASNRETAIIQSIRRAMRHVVETLNFRQRCERLDHFFVVMHWPELVNGISTPTDLARQQQKTKQNVNHSCMMLRDVMQPGMKAPPPAPGQRDRRTRDKFIRVRLEKNGAKR